MPHSFSLVSGGSPERQPEHTLISQQQISSAAGVHPASHVHPLARVAIRCVGHLQVSLGNEPVDLRGKARELLAYLATRPFLSAGHDTLLDALWPDHDPARAERLLYNAAWKVRSSLDLPSAAAGFGSRREVRPRRGFDVRRGHRSKAVPASALLTERGFYALNTARCRVDVAGLLDQVATTEAAVRDGVCKDVAATWLALAQAQPQPERLLIDEPFEWLPTLRDELRASSEQILMRAFTCAERVGDTGAALDALHRLLVLDPLREDAVAQAMDLHLVRGEAAAAARCYRTFRVALQRDYGLAEGAGSDAGEDGAFPSCELRVLYARATARSDTGGGPPRALGPPNL